MTPTTPFADTPQATVSRLRSLIPDTPPTVSFEFFPPKSADAEDDLWNCITTLAPLNPLFVSVTYGAGGTTRARTHQTVKRILEETRLTPAAHLTCVGSSKEEIAEIIAEYKSAGVKHIVALRGDPPKDQPDFVPHPNGYHHANELVEAIAKAGGFEISVAAYPEKHPEAISAEADLDYLKRKIDAGATRAITQFFFDVELFLRFLDKTRAAGIKVPITPGILPVTNFGQMKRFAAMCGTAVPDWVEKAFDGLVGDPQTRNLVSAMLVAEQCRLLRAAGINEFHFYTLNRAALTKATCHLLGIRPRY